MHSLERIFEDFEIKFDIKNVFVEPETGHFHYRNETIITPEEAHLVSMPVVAEWHSDSLFSFPDFEMRCAFTNPEDPDRVYYAVVPFSSTQPTTSNSRDRIAYEYGLALFNFVYYTIKQTPSAAECAYLYRKYNNICHACYGDGVEQNTDTPAACSICNGTGYFDHPKY